MTTQAPDLAQSAPGLSVVPSTPKPAPVLPFKPVASYPDQLRPTPWSLPGLGTVSACVSLFQRSPEVTLALSGEECSSYMRMTADHARCLAWQLLDAADQVDARGAK